MFKCWEADDDESSAETAPSYCEDFRQAVDWFANRFFEGQYEMTIMVRDPDGLKKMFTVEARTEFDIFEEDLSE